MAPTFPGRRSLPAAPRDFYGPSNSIRPRPGHERSPAAESLGGHLDGPAGERHGFTLEGDSVQITSRAGRIHGSSGPGLGDGT